MRSSRSSRAAAIAYPNDADGADGGGLLRRAAGWIAAAALAVIGVRIFIEGALPFLIEISPDVFGEHYWPRRGLLLTHIAAGSVALFVGPLQLLSGLRRRAGRLHRWIGRVYLACVAVGGTAAFALAPYAAPLATRGLSLAALGVAWWTTTLMAYLAIRHGRVTAHREWMTRSYIVTFSFVTFRWWADLGLLHGLARDSVAVLIFLSWSVPLLAAEIVIRARKARTNRGSVRNRMRGSRIP